MSLSKIEQAHLDSVITEIKLGFKYLDSIRLSYNSHNNKQGEQVLVKAWKAYWKAESSLNLPTGVSEEVRSIITGQLTDLRVALLALPDSVDQG